MIYSELYGAYYNAVAAILAEAVKKPLTSREIRRIIEEKAFGESVLNIEPALSEGRWPLLDTEGRSRLIHAPAMPLTTLQKRWINAIALDKRIRLFTDEPVWFDDVTPLFRSEDYEVYDRYADGDPYEDEAYIAIFRMILQAIRDGQPLSVRYISGRGKLSRKVVLPRRLEYSEKDDKFRLIGSEKRCETVINLRRIKNCRIHQEPFVTGRSPEPEEKRRSVTFELKDERNALERVLLHFAHFEKQAERQGENRYLITVMYDKDDETEILIRLLSFGPMIRVIEPESMTALIRERLKMQKSCGR